MFFFETSSQREGKRVQRATQRSRDIVELSRFIEILRRDLRDGTIHDHNRFDWLKTAFSKNPGTSLVQYSFARECTDKLGTRFNFELGKWTAAAYYDKSKTSIFDGLAINLILDELKKQEAVLVFEGDDIDSHRETTFHYLYNGFRTQESKLKVTIHFRNRDANSNPLYGYFSTSLVHGDYYFTSFKQKFSLVPARETIVNKFNQTIENQNMRNSLARTYNSLPNTEAISRKTFKSVLETILTEIPTEVINPGVLGNGKQPHVQRGVFKYSAPGEKVERGVEVEVIRKICCGAPYSIAVRPFWGTEDAATAPFLESHVHNQASALLEQSIQPCSDHHSNHYNPSNHIIENMWLDKSHVSKYAFKW